MVQIVLVKEGTGPWAKRGREDAVQSTKYASTAAVNPAYLLLL